MSRNRLWSTSSSRTSRTESSKDMSVSSPKPSLCTDKDEPNHSSTSLSRKARKKKKKGKQSQKIPTPPITTTESSTVTVILADGGPIKQLKRHILTEASPVWETMLADGATALTLESTVREVKLTSKVVLDVLCFLVKRSANEDVDNQNAIQMLALADRYQVDVLLSKCKDYLIMKALITTEGAKKELFDQIRVAARFELKQVCKLLIPKLVHMQHYELNQFIQTVRLPGDIQLAISRVRNVCMEKLSNCWHRMWMPPNYYAVSCSRCSEVHNSLVCHQCLKFFCYKCAVEDGEGEGSELAVKSVCDVETSTNEERILFLEVVYSYRYRSEDELSVDNIKQLVYDRQSYYYGNNYWYEDEEGSQRYEEEGGAHQYQQYFSAEPGTSYTTVDYFAEGDDDAYASR